MRALCKSCYPKLCRCLRGFTGALKWASMTPIGASLSVGCPHDHCRNTKTALHKYYSPSAPRMFVNTTIDVFVLHWCYPKNIPHYHSDRRRIQVATKLSLFLFANITHMQGFFVVSLAHSPNAEIFFCYQHWSHGIEIRSRSLIQIVLRLNISTRTN